MTNRRLGVLVVGLGIGQICSWGSLFYSIAVLGARIGEDLGLGKTAIFGAFSLGLFVLGCVAPTAGKLIDARGGRVVMACGSLLGAVALYVLARSNGPAMFYAGWCIAGLAMALTLYDPAFSTLSQHAGTSYRRALTALTLIAGFASTVFWPASVFLLRELDWRGTLMVFACIHLLLCLPIHLLVIPAHAATIPVIKPPPVSAAIDTTRRATFLWLALAFGLNAVIFSAMSAHLVGLLHDKGLSAEIAVTVAACIGPMQVAGRIVEMVFGRHWSPIGTGFFALGLLSVSLALLYLIGSSAALAFVFAVAYGWSNGILTIVRGTVPAELLGREAYGHLLGRLARATYLSQAVAPVAFALVLSTGAGYGLGVLALLAVALATLIAYFMATRRNLVSRRPQSVPIN